MFRQKLSLVFALICFSFLLSSFVQAAPARWGIAIHENLNTCGGYWAGDEFVGYPLPDHWLAFYPDYDQETGTNIISTPYGSCDFIRNSAESCCAQLGLSYVGDQVADLDEDFTNPTMLPDLRPAIIALVITCVVCFSLIMAIIILLYRKLKAGKT